MENFQDIDKIPYLFPPNLFDTHIKIQNLENRVENTMIETLVRQSIISGLGGYVGSNPKVIKVYPETEIPETLLLRKSLPDGCKPGQIIIDKVEGQKIFAYVFDIEKENERNDLASIGFIIDEDVIVEELEVLTKELIAFLKGENMLKFEILEKILPVIIEGFNSQEKMHFEVGVVKSKNDFNTKKVIKKNKLKLKKEARIKKGGFL